MQELTAQQIELISRVVLKEFEKQRENEEKKEKHRRLRNTKLLLRNYNTFKNYAEKHKLQKQKEKDIPITELILNGEDIVESIRQTTEKTLAMIRYLDNALNTLQHICEVENSKHYDVLRLRFLEQRAIEEIAEKFHVNERTVYKQIDAAVEPLSVLLFGVYGLKII